MLVLQQRSCLCREAVCQQKGTLCQVTLFSGAGQSHGACSQPSLPRQPGDTWVLGRAVCVVHLSPVSPGDPGTSSFLPVITARRSKQVSTYSLFNRGGSSYSKASANTITSQYHNRNTSRLQQHQYQNITH